MHRITLYVKGKVQKVGYRAKVKEIADRLGLTGYVENLGDGRVKSVAEGPSEQLEKFRKDINIRNTLTIVEHIEYNYSDYTGEFKVFEKVVKDGEVHERFDEAIEYLKEMIKVMSAGFKGLNETIIDGNKELKETIISTSKETQEVLKDAFISGNTELKETIISTSKETQTVLKDAIFESGRETQEVLKDAFISGNKELKETIISTSKESQTVLKGAIFDSARETQNVLKDVIISTSKETQTVFRESLTESTDNNNNRFDALSEDIHGLNNNLTTRFDWLAEKYGEFGRVMRSLEESMGTMKDDIHEMKESFDTVAKFIVDNK